MFLFIVLYNSLSLKRAYFSSKKFGMEKLQIRKKKKNIKFEIYFIGKDR